MFKERFVQPIRSGTKHLTIRETAAGVVAGDELSLRRWTGLPYRSKQEEIRQVRVHAVARVLLDVGQAGNLIVLFGHTMLSPRDVEKFAVGDGFASAAEMLEYWQPRLPFGGQAIYWETLP